MRDVDTGIRSPAARRRLWTAAGAVVLVGVLAVIARLFVWPDLPALPQHADAIVQLGGPGNRRVVALALARQGRAPVVAISVSDDEVGTSWCAQGRLNDVAVICFHSDPFTTRGEARDVADMATRYGWHSVILVTTPDQAWRATVRERRCFPGEIYVATARLPWYLWPTQVVYQVAATAKAFTVETAC
jgi:uncharacterized SAM-binding protein YcdF (DUF218 family)